MVERNHEGETVSTYTNDSELILQYKRSMHAIILYIAHFHYKVSVHKTTN